MRVRPCAALVEAERDGSPVEVLGPEELAAESTADRGEEVEHRVGPVLTGPLPQDEPRRREELPEELLAVLPLSAASPLQLPGHGDESREQDLYEHPAHEGVGAGLPEQHPDQAGGLLTLGSTRGAPHVLYDVDRRRARRRCLRRPDDEERQPLVVAGDVPERADGVAGPTDRLPFGRQLVDEGDALLRCGGGHGATVATGPPPIAPTVTGLAAATAGTRDSPGGR